MPARRGTKTLTTAAAAAEAERAQAREEAARMVSGWNRMTTAEREQVVSERLQRRQIMARSAMGRAASAESQSASASPQMRVYSRPGASDRRGRP